MVSLVVDCLVEFIALHVGVMGVGGLGTEVLVFNIIFYAVIGCA